MRFTFLLALSFAVLLSASTAHAQINLNATIPFAFQIGETVLPAGDYSVSHEAQTGLVRVAAQSGKMGVAVHSQPVGGGPAASDGISKLVFRRYGHNYFLSEAWTSDSNTGRAVLQSRKEKEIAHMRLEPPVRVLVAQR